MSTRVSFILGVHPRTSGDIEALRTTNKLLDSESNLRIVSIQLINRLVDWRMWQ